MKTALTLVALICIIGLLSLFGWAMTEIVIGTFAATTDGLARVLLIGGGAVVVSLGMAFAVWILQPAIYLLGAVAAAIGALISYFCRSRT